MVPRQYHYIIERLENTKFIIVKYIGALHYSLELASKYVVVPVDSGCSDSVGHCCRDIGLVGAMEEV